MNKTTQRDGFLRLLAFPLFPFLFSLGIAGASAQGYPAKPVKIVTGFAGGSDLMARVMAQHLTPLLGQQVFVEQRLGAAGSIGFEYAARQAPDGYTLLLGAITLVTNPYVQSNVKFDPVRDFAPVALLSTIPNGLFVHPSVPAKSLKELVALARTSPGKIAYGSGGVGSANHLAAEFLQSMAKIRFTHVPYKSATLGIAGALSGDVDMVITVVSSGASYVKNGRMRGLVVMDAARSVALPDMPTTAEQGYPQLKAINWYTLMAPAGTPKPVIDRLYAASAKVITSPAVQKQLRSMGGEPGAATPEQTAEFIRADFARWGKVIKEAGLKAK